MTENEITAIANEYAEECVDPQEFSEGTYKELVEEKAESVAYVLRWLSSRYYFVDRDILLNQDIAKRVKEHRCVMLDIEEVYDLFPELAKEVQ